MSFLKKISAGLKKTTEQFSGGIDNVFQSSKIPEETISDLEDFMISSDIGLPLTEKIITNLRNKKVLKLSLIHI